MVFKWYVSNLMWSSPFRRSEVIFSEYPTHFAIVSITSITLELDFTGKCLFGCMSAKDGGQLFRGRLRNISHIKTRQIGNGVTVSHPTQLYCSASCLGVSEKGCPVRMRPTIMLFKNSDNSRCLTLNILALVYTDS